MGDTFELVAMQMTKSDVGGKAGRQLDITEARQGLTNALKVMANQLTLKEVAILLLDYIETTEV